MRKYDVNYLYFCLRLARKSGMVESDFEDDESYTQLTEDDAWRIIEALELLDKKESNNE